MENNSRRLLVLLLSGLATAPAFMDPIGLELQRRLLRYEAQVETISVFPYGDWGRKAFVQLGEIAFDWRLSASKFTRAIGVNRIWPYVSERLEQTAVLIIGHSGGGVAGLHAARKIRVHAPEVQVRTVMIGSPRCRLTPEERMTMLSITAARRNGRAADPVGRLGSWAGWERSTRGRMSWNPYKYAPATRFELPIIGSHPDYFRAYEPFINDAGQSNLELTAGCIEQWTVIELGMNQGSTRAED